MSGYLNRYVVLTFPHLAEGCSVLVRNPKLMAPEELEAAAAATDDNGEIADRELARAGMNKVFAGMIVAWRNVYPAQVDMDGIDLNGDGDLEALMADLEGRAQEPLGNVTPDNVGKLPLAIINRIGEEIKKVSDPQ